MQKKIVLRITYYKPFVVPVPILVLDMHYIFMFIEDSSHLHTQNALNYSRFYLSSSLDFFLFTLPLHMISIFELLSFKLYFMCVSKIWLVLVIFHYCICDEDFLSMFPYLRQSTDCFCREPVVDLECIQCLHKNAHFRALII